MKKFFLYLFIVLLGVSIIDVAYRGVCKLTLKETAIDNNNYNIAVLGASRAELQYRSKIIADSLNLTVYNYGQAGTSILNQYFTLLEITKNKTPEIVILDLTPNQLSSDWIKKRISRYYPDYWKNETVRDVINEVEGYNHDLIMTSALVQYNSKLFNIVVNLIKDVPVEENELGFFAKAYSGEPVEVREKDIVHERLNSNGGYSEFADLYLKRMVDICDQKSIKLIVCMSPSLVLDDNDRFFLLSKVKELNLLCWDMTDSIKDPLLFYDASHLNDRGATLFTEMIVANLKGMLD